MADSLQNHVNATPEEIATQDELQRLYGQLEKMITYHREALVEENALADVMKLQQWIEACQEGSLQAERKLYNEGISLLENVKGKLTLALQEQQRIVEESPTAAINAKGRSTERYAKASSRANEALCTLSTLTECETSEGNAIPQKQAK